MSKHLFIIAALSFFFLRHSIAEANSSICSASGCGDGVPIRYPFWLHKNSSQQNCGYPDFGLKCSHNGRPILSLPTGIYYITDINYDDHTLTLVDVDLVNQSCPRARNNVSLGNFPLSFNHQLNVNLSFYFNCSVSNVGVPPQHIGCLKNEGPKQSFLLQENNELNLDCEQKVVVAVKEEEIRRSDDLATRFGEAMNKGFVLDWKTTVDCSECEESGGLCGQSQTNNQTLCFCEDGRIATKTRSCSKDKEYRECGPSPCGRVGEIDYPFWSENGRPDYCGRPEFRLYCPLYEDDYPVIKIGSQTFNVIQIDLEHHKMRLLRTDFVYNNCSSSSHFSTTSLSTPLNVFHYDEPSVKNVSLFYSCYRDYNSTGTIKFECQSPTDYPYINYAFFPEDVVNETLFLNLVDNCGRHIEVPVSIETDAHILEEALGKGFGVLYEGDESCAKCMDSDGRCGSSDTSPFVCYCRDGPHPLRCPLISSRHSLRTKLIIGVNGAIGMLLLCITVCCCKIESWKRRIGLSKTSEVDQNIEAFIRNHGALALTRYKFADVKKMTNSFKDNLGQGGYGSVYKGKLLNGCPVAVKLLKATNENGEDFINEVASISRTSHVNVVALLGFCFEGRKKALIYEFMPNGSLDKFIHNNTDGNSLCLTWENLYQIATGIARGLEYLHRGCSTRILHFDIKPHNIFLDESFCPKIADFGLAKLCLKKDSIISISEARGTVGYLAPEVWNRNIGGVSHKSDVYSYGMMLLDMVGGRKNMNVKTNCSTNNYFPDYIYAQLEQDNSLGCNDTDANYMEENDIVKRMTIVGLWCIQTIPSQRPTMSRVIEMLERSHDLLEMPPKPAMPAPPPQYYKGNLPPLQTPQQRNWVFQAPPTCCCRRNTRIQKCGKEMQVGSHTITMACMVIKCRYT